MRAALVLLAAAWALPAHANRVVALGGALTETVLALGAEDALVGIDDSARALANAPKLPSVGYYRKFSAEGVLALRPTQVLALDQAGPAAALSQLKAAKVPLEVLPAEPSVAVAKQRIARLGELLGKPQAAAGLNARIDAALAKAQAQRPSAPVRVLPLFLHGGRQLQMVGQRTPAAALVEIVGGTLAMQRPGFAPLSAEGLLAARPDVIVLTPRCVKAAGGMAKVWALPGLAATPAGKARRVVVLDDHALMGFGPSLADGIAGLSDAVAQAAR